MQAAHYLQIHRIFQIIPPGKIPFGIKNDDQGNLTGEGESYDSSRIILTPGKTAKDLGFAWYSLEKGEPAVKIGKKEDLSDAQEFKGTATEINRSNQKNTYKASNKVTVEGLFRRKYNLLLQLSER